MGSKCVLTSFTKSHFPHCPASRTRFRRGTTEYLIHHSHRTPADTFSLLKHSLWETKKKNSYLNVPCIWKFSILKNRAKILESLTLEIKSSEHTTLYNSHPSAQFILLKNVKQCRNTVCLEQLIDMRLTPVILANWEAEAGGSQVGSQPWL